MAFFQCPKCKKKWQYPIEKCPQCFEDLIRMRPEKIKVIGVSKSTAPTLFHPFVPYFVLLLEDEKGNRWVQKSQKEYKIGQDFKITPASEKNAVAVWKIKYDILEGLEMVEKLISGIGNLTEKKKILILPSLTIPNHPHLRDNTSPEFLEAVLKFLIEKGAKTEKIKVASQSFDEIPIESTAVKSQLVEICQKFNITPLDLAKGDFLKKEKDGFNFEISKEIFDSDLIINLPILKIGKMSASENILKLIKKENYLGLKYLHPEEEILENLNKVLPNFLTLAEANYVQKPNKLVGFLGLILASFNVLHLDRVFAEITLNTPEELKKIEIKNIPIVGREIEELKYGVGISIKLVRS